VQNNIIFPCNFLTDIYVITQNSLLNKPFKASGGGTQVIFQDFIDLVTRDEIK
jgi:hypothetical protein